jgi:hypothetical protein
MAMYASMKLVATGGKKLTVSLVVFATIDLFERVPVRWMFPREFLSIAFDIDLHRRDLLSNNPTAVNTWKVMLKTSIVFL